MNNRTDRTHPARMRALPAALGLLLALLAALVLITPTSAMPKGPKPTPTPTPTPTPVGAGSWAITGSPTTYRGDFASVRLADGRVLVSGGSDGSGSFTWLTSAELYNPATGSWSPTGAMVHGRRFHTLTLLADGRVLAVGGEDGAGGITAELFDPVTGVWMPTGNMSLPRHGHRTVRLNDGRILVAGGEVFSSALYVGEVYDPATGVWTTTPASPSPMYRGALVLLADGRVLAAGADFEDFYGGWSATASIYDPVSNTWAVTGSMIQARSQPLAGRLPDGRVLVVGNKYGGKAAELYDPATGTWSSTASMNLGHGNGALSLLADGRVLVTGGANDQFGFDIVAAAEIYDPATGLWQPAASMNVARQYHATETLLDGRVLAILGWNRTDPVAPRAEVYTP